MSQYVETLEFYIGGLPLVSNTLSLSQEVQFNYASQHEPLEKKNNNENIEPIDLVHVKLGQYYELLVTSYAGLYRYKVGDVLKVTGFHNNTPQFQFVGRQTCYTDTCSIPGHYVLFWELKAKQGNDSIELDQKIMEECCYRMEEALYYIYRSCRKQNAIAALEIRVVK
ncbi:indole-3-acetic acid-amido synthetase GH3.17-like [Gossypium hirsutum]|uniref:Indole-3-acetic acid-amido synthetase GH3.17-like n=1 Tax=Gossypium hirsutum TaxID=3635 RepID=A0A1U8KN77_GOSHI|nr:indole-3-acetic acid-amido synthetase GH3.17-like [Gossypium hirsutum]